MIRSRPRWSNRRCSRLATCWATSPALTLSHRRAPGFSIGSELARREDARIPCVPDRYPIARRSRFERPANVACGGEGRLATRTQRQAQVWPAGFPLVPGHRGLLLVVLAAPEIGAACARRRRAARAVPGRGRADRVPAGARPQSRAVGLLVRGTLESSQWCRRRRAVSLLRAELPHPDRRLLPAGAAPSRRRCNSNRSDWATQPCTSDRFFDPLRHAAAAALIVLEIAIIRDRRNAIPDRGRSNAPRSRGRSSRAVRTSLAGFGARARRRARADRWTCERALPGVKHDGD